MHWPCMLLASYNQSYGDYSSRHMLYDIMAATRAVVSGYQSPCFVWFFVGAGEGRLGNTVSFRVSEGRINLCNSGRSTASDLPS